MRVFNLRVAGGLAAVAIILAACGGGSPTATPLPSPTVAPTATRSAVTPTTAAATPTRAAATATQVAATPTQARPAATPTPAPTATPLPTATATAAAPSVKRGGTLRQAGTADPVNFDIHQQTNTISIYPAAPAYDTLMTLDLDQWEKVVPVLAKSWQVSADGKTYMLQIQQGVKWQDGQPFTAEDVVYNVKRWIDPPKGTTIIRGPWYKGVITEARATDPNTVVLTLAMADGSMPAKLANGYQPMMPKQIIEAKGSMKDTVMGTGPFKFVRFTPGSVLELERNKDYWLKDRPYLDAFQWFIVPDASAREAAFRTGRIDTVGGSFDVVQTLKRSVANMVADEEVQGSPASLYFNSGKPPFNDQRLRRAIQLLVDRQKMVDILAPGYGKIGAYAPFPSSWGMTREELVKQPGFRQPKTQDIADGKKLLADAGFANGLEVEVIVRNNADWMAFTVALQDQLKAYGIRFNIKQVDTATHVQMRAEKTLLAHGIASTAAPLLADPTVYLEYYPTNTPQTLVVGFSDAEVDRLVAAISVETDFAKRNQLFRQTQLRLLEMVPSVPTHYFPAYLIKYPYVRNLPTGPDRTTFYTHRDVWLDK